MSEEREKTGADENAQSETDPQASGVGKRANRKSGSKSDDVESPKPEMNKPNRNVSPSQRRQPDMNRAARSDETIQLSLKAPLKYAVGGHDVRSYPAGPCSVHPAAAKYAEENELVGDPAQEGAE